MKLPSLKLLATAVLAMCGTTAMAQLVGDQIFLQGRWLEVGVAPNGSWGNTMPVPAGYHSHTGAFPSYPDPITGVTPTGNGLDFSFDVGKDGWTIGSPIPASGTNCCFYGPYFLPGTPFDGWTVQMNGVRNDAFFTTAGFTSTGGVLTGTNTGYESELGSPSGPYMESTAAGIWNGTYTAGGSTIAIRTVNRVDTNASWDKVNVTFRNTGATPANDIYYMVTADPDNDQVIPTGSFPTDNRINYQLDAQNRVGVSSISPLAGRSDAFSGLVAKDCRAKALIYVSWPPPLVAGNALDLIYNETATGLGTAYYALGAQTLSQDIAYGLIFKVGTLAPGDSTTISFAWIFSDTTTIDSAFRKPQLNVNNFLSPTDSTFYYACGLGTIPVNIVNGEWGVTNWKWSPALGLASTTGIRNSLNIAALSGAEQIYTITGTDTASCNEFRLILHIPSCHTATTNSPDSAAICEGDTLMLYDNGDSTGATYIWYGPGMPGPIRGTTQYATIFPAAMSDTGWYYSVKTVGAVTDTARVHVMIKKLPNVTATFNAPLCSGRTLILTSTPDYVGETWEWRSPDGWTSTLSDPTRATAPTSYSGVYTVVTTLNGCTDSGTVNVVIDSTPAVPILTSNAPVCEGDTLFLFCNPITPGVSFAWTGPSGFSSSLQNPFIANPDDTLSTGTYSVTTRLGNCTNSASLPVVVKHVPVPVLGSNSPVCSGTILNLTTTAPPGSTFEWWGPLTFTSTLQYPSINPAITANSGTYSVVVTLNGCSSDTVSIPVVVDSTPETPVISTNSPGPPGATICEGDTLKLFAFTPTMGANYSWTGPNSFASTQANPMIIGATPLATGVYTLVVSMGSCSVTVSLAATVTPTPPISITSNTPVCSGVNDTLMLNAIGNPGSTYVWAGPYTFTSASQNPMRTPVEVEHGGVYHVTVTLDGCTNSASHTVVVNRTPDAPWVKWLTYCQYYDAPYLQAGGDNLLWYPSSSSVVGSGTPPKPNTDLVGTTFYYVNQTVANCPSKIDSIRVTINPKPTVTVSEDRIVCPWDSVVITAVNTDAIAFYNWSPSMYLSDTSGPVVVARPETNIEYRVITTNMYGCTDSAYVNMTVKAEAVVHVEDSVRIYPGESYQINAVTNCSSVTWSPSGSLSGKYITNPIATPEISTRYVITGMTEWGCTAKDSISVIVSADAILDMPNAFSPGGVNKLFKIQRRGIVTLNHFRIYDRWGVLVYDGNEIDGGWDGTYKGVPQPMGVYIYDISATTAAGKVFKKSGNVTLLR